MSREVTVTSPSVRIRRAPTTNAGVIRVAVNGEHWPVLDIVQNGKETWARIAYKENGKDVDAYVCVTMSTGSELCVITGIDTQSEFAKGYKAGMMYAHGLLTEAIAKL